MNKTVKAVLSAIVIVAMAFCITAVSASDVSDAETGKYSGDGFTLNYSTDGDTVSITGYSVTGTSPVAIIIPSQIDNKNVVSVGGMDKKEIEGEELKGDIVSLTIGENVETIEQYAFKNQTVLKSIHLPSTIKSIDDFSFYNLPSLETITIGENGSTENGEYKITDGAIVSGKKVILRAAHYADDDGVFTVPNGVTYFVQHALDHSNVTKISLPASFISVDVGYFSLCKDLKAFEVRDGNNKFCVIKDADGDEDSALGEYKNSRIYLKVLPNGIEDFIVPSDVVGSSNTPISVSNVDSAPLI